MADAPSSCWTSVKSRSCDSTGLHTLLDVANRCRQLGVTLRLANLAAAVQRVMELTNIIGRFNVEVDLRPQRTRDLGRL
jgi:anti-anti-sigma factor